MLHNERLGITRQIDEIIIADTCYLVLEVSGVWLCGLSSLTIAPHHWSYGCHTTWVVCILLFNCVSCVPFVAVPWYPNIVQATVAGWTPADHGTVAQPQALAHAIHAGTLHSSETDVMASHVRLVDADVACCR